jgi:LysM repeat protein
MKSKKISFKFLILQLVALTGLLLTQGCATGQCPVDWLNWPYDTPTEKPLIYPADDYTTATDDILLPPDAYTSAPFETPDTYVPYETTDVPVAASQSYVVKKGDTLSAIASMYGTSWKKLAAYNNLSNPNKLFVGQTISIPGDLEVLTTPVARASTPTTGSVRTSGAPIAQGSSYVIQRGDTLSGIATRAGLTAAEIKAANALTSNRIVTGKSLSIPKKGEVTADAYSAPVFDPAPVAVAPIADLAPIAELAPVATSSSAPVYEHVLYPGETIEDVARQYGSSPEEILLLNGIADPSVVKPGTKLLVPIPE